MPAILRDIVYGVCSVQENGTEKRSVRATRQEACVRNKYWSKRQRHGEVPALVEPGTVLVCVAASLISSGTESGFLSEGGTAGYVLKKARTP